ncbi:MAG: hypothetical protein P1P85_01945 [Patescibacteria group bacterium]|nr:hypothetical protein [Patescibacteria group bacterium]
MKKIKKIKTKFSGNDLKKILNIFLRFRYLFILLFLGSLFIFSFKFIYEHAYMNIQYIDYKEYENQIIYNVKSENKKLSNLLNDLNEDRVKFESELNKEYSNPFEFGIEDVLIIDELDINKEENKLSEQIIDSEEDLGTK